MSDRKIRLGVLLTYGVSLSDWRESGLLSREINAYRHLEQAEFEVTFISWGDASDIDVAATADLRVLPIYARTGRPKSRVLRLLKSFFVYFLLPKEFKSFDLVKTNQMMGSWVLWPLRLLARKKFVLRTGYEALHNHFRESKGLIRKWLVSGFLYLVEAVSYTLADRVFLSCESARRFTFGLFPWVAKEKIRLFRNAVDTERFSASGGPPSRGLRELVYVGRLEPVKNLDALLGALHRLGDRPTLHLIGDGTQRERLADTAQRLGLSVEFHGSLPNEKLPGLVSRYAFFILPSLFENSPKSLLEAMACGRVVLASDAPGIRELIVDGDTGLLGGSDTHGLAGLMERALQLEDQDLDGIGRRARIIVETELSLAAVQAREAAVYRELIGVRE